MPRRPEHPLHVTLTGWGQWARAGRHDPQGWYSSSPQAPDRPGGGAPCSRPPNLRPGPPMAWLRIDAAVSRLCRENGAQQPMNALIGYYVLRNSGWCEQCRRGCDMVMAAMAMVDVDK